MYCVFIYAIIRIVLSPFFHRFFSFYFIIFISMILFFSSTKNTIRFYFVFGGHFTLFLSRSLFLAFALALLSPCLTVSFRLYWKTWIRHDKNKRNQRRQKNARGRKCEIVFLYITDLFTFLVLLHFDDTNKCENSYNQKQKKSQNKKEKETKEIECALSRLFYCAMCARVCVRECVGVIVAVSVDFFFFLHRFHS